MEAYIQDFLVTSQNQFWGVYEYEIVWYSQSYPS